MPFLDNFRVPIHPLSSETIPERDFIENLQGCTLVQLLARGYFPPQLVEEVFYQRDATVRRL